MKYIISKCKKCGATVQSFVELSQEATCPECGGHEFSKVKEEESLVKPVNYCPPSSTVETFMEVVARIAVERDMPEDCLQAIDPKRLCKYWVPSYYFQGTFDGQWKCQVKGGMKVSINNGKEIEIPDGAPLQGSAKNVPFSFLVPSVDLENAEPWVSEFPAISTDEKGESISSEAILQDASMLTLPFVPNALQQWSAIGNKVGDSVIEDYATEELQDSLTMYHALGILTDDEYALMHNSMNGKPLKMGTTEYKNWEVFSRSTVTKSGPAILIPAYYLPFDYQGHTCYFSVLARGETCSMIYHLPNVSTTENEDVQEKAAQKKLNLIKYCGWLAILVFFMLNLVSALVYLVAWFAAYKYFQRDVEKLQAKALDEKERKKQASIAKLKKRLTEK